MTTNSDAILFEKDQEISRLKNEIEELKRQTLNKNTFKAEMAAIIDDIISFYPTWEDKALELSLDATTIFTTIHSQTQLIDTIESFNYKSRFVILEAIKTEIEQCEYIVERDLFIGLERFSFIKLYAVDLVLKDLNIREHCDLNKKCDIRKVCQLKSVYITRILAALTKYINQILAINNI